MKKWVSLKFLRKTKRENENGQPSSTRCTSRSVKGGKRCCVCACVCGAYGRCLFPTCGVADFLSAQPHTQTLDAVQ